MKKILFIISYTILFLVALLNLEVVLDGISLLVKVIFPFLLGGAIAFVLNIPMSFVEKYTKKYFIKHPKLLRPFSYFSAVFFVVIILGIVIFIVVPELTVTILSLTKTIEAFVPQAVDWLESMIQQPEIVAWLDSIKIDWDAIIDSIFVIIKGSFSNVVSSSLEMTITIISSFVNFLIGFIVSCYVLLQKETFAYQAKKVLFSLLPESRARKAVEVIKLTNHVFYHFITGQCLEALILGMMFFVTMSILGMPYALLVGVLISVTALIPIVGAFIGCFVGAFLILMVNPLQAGIFIIVFLVLQQIEGNIIYPQVVGNSVGLPSIWVLFSVVVGGNLFGVLGMLLLIPINSVLYTLFKQWSNKQLDKKNIKIRKSNH